VPSTRVGFRFSLLALFGLITLLALGLASLMKASPLLASAWFTFVVVFIIAATLAAAVRRGKGRVFWFGCAVAGWIYVVMTFSPLIGLQVPPPLLTSQCLLWLDNSLTDDEVESRQVLFTTSFGWLEPRDNVIRIWDVNAGRPQGLREANFQQIGHCILTLLTALVGGIFASYLRSGDREPHKRPH
jgi:hypothetical protein